MSPGNGPGHPSAWNIPRQPRSCWPWPRWWTAGGCSERQSARIRVGTRKIKKLCKQCVQGKYEFLQLLDGTAGSEAHHIHRCYCTHPDKAHFERGILIQSRKTRKYISLFAGCKFHTNEWQLDDVRNVKIECHSEEKKNLSFFDNIAECRRAVSICVDYSWNIKNYIDLKVYIASPVVHVHESSEG